MLDFYKTGGGRKFFDFTIPNLIRALENLTKELKRTSDRKKAENDSNSTDTE